MPIHTLLNNNNKNLISLNQKSGKQKDEESAEIRHLRRSLCPHQKWKERQMMHRLASAAFDPGSPNALLHARPNPPLNSEVGRLPVGLHIIQFKLGRATGQRKASLTSCPVILTIYRLFRSDLISQERRERKNTTGRTQSINYICWHVRFGFSCWKREPHVSRFCGGCFLWERKAMRQGRSPQPSARFRG